MNSVLESAVIPSLSLAVGDRLYTVEFPLSAVIQAEEKTGRSLKSLSDWFSIPTKDVSAVLEAGLSKHHPDIGAEQVQAICDRLNPEALDEVQYALCKLAFPRGMELLEKQIKARKTSPNAPGGAFGL